MAVFSRSKVKSSVMMVYPMQNDSVIIITKNFFVNTLIEKMQHILWDSLQTLTEHYNIVPTQVVSWLYKGVKSQSQGNVVKHYIKPAMPMMILKCLTNCNHTFVLITEPAQKPDEVSVTTLSGNNIISIENTLKTMETKIKNSVNIEMIKRTHFALESVESTRHNFISIFQAICFLKNIPVDTPMPEYFPIKLRKIFNDAYEDVFL